MNGTNNNNSAQPKAGLNCPQCGTFIETNILQLLTSNALVCPSCHLRLNIDRGKSKQALDVLRKVKMAQDNVASKSKFSK